MHWNPSLAEGDDFWVTCKTSKTLPVRGAFFQGDYPNPHIEHASPSTMVDFSESIAGVPVPVVSHENGSFQVSPDFREIPKYTGVTRARNLEIFRERLREAGMLDQAHDFVRASGALSVICHREDIEASLRTPGFGGFQLLDLQDFPGQGTALVGMLNVFMESKGLITPEAWRQFCCETVPLLRMKKYTWTTDETFIGRVAGGPLRPGRFARRPRDVDGHRQRREEGRRRCVRSGDDRAGQGVRGRYVRAAAGRYRRAAEADDHGGHRGDQVSQRLRDLGLSAEGRHRACRRA